MNIKKLLFLFAMPLYCLGEVINITNHDYTMVDLRNGLTTKLLAAGPTSITISVEWPLDIEIEHGILYLMGKRDVEKRVWDYLEQITISLPQGKGIFEVLYKNTSWHYFKETTNFENKVWFAVRVPHFGETEDAPIRGKYEEDDEEDDRRVDETRKKIVAEQERENAAILQQSRKEEARRYVNSVEVEGHQDATTFPLSHSWLYSAILIAICAFFYFVWSKRKKTL